MMDSLARENELRPLLNGEPRRSMWSRIRDPKRFFVVEPLLLIIMAAYVAYNPLANQYIYGRIARDNFNISFDEAETEEMDDDCHSPNATDKDHIFDQIQAMTSSYMIYLRLADGIPSLFSCLVMGAYSDRAGRRVTMLLAMVGLLCRNVFGFAIIYGDLDLSFFIIANVLSGLSGGFGLVITSALAYITDTVEKEQKGLRMAIIEAILGTATAGASLGIGLWIHSVGFVEPMLCICVANFAAIMYLAIFVPESLKQRDPSEDGRYKSFLEFLQTVTKPFTTMDANWTSRMILIAASTLFVVSVVSRADVMVLFLLNYPLCWDAKLIGIFGGTSSAISVATSLTTIKLLRGKVPMSSLIVVGIVSCIVGSVWQSFATTTFLMFMVTIFGMFIFVAMPLFKANISSLTPPEMQGSLFAAMSCLETFMNVAASVTVTWVYSFTASFFPGLVFILLGGVAALSLLLVVIKLIKDRRGRDYAPLAHPVNANISDEEDA